MSLPTIHPPRATPGWGIAPERLGSPAFRRRHGLRYNYVAGAMYKGIASKELVIRMGRAGLLGFLGSGGLQPNRLEADVRFIQAALGNGGIYGVNLLASPFAPHVEEAVVDLLLRYGVRRVEAAAFTQMTPALVRYRANGLTTAPGNSVGISHLVLAKVSRPEVAEQFLRPAPAAILKRLVDDGRITPLQAKLAERVPMADDLCVEADSGGHTDRGVLHAIFPVIRRLRDSFSDHSGAAAAVCVGAAGGLGTPESIAAAFILGADFVLTGSINQCTVEAGTSEAVKDLLQEAHVQDTDVVPAGDAFEMGGKVQVFRKGLLFPARAKKLYELYRQFHSLDQIDEQTRHQIESRYFKRSFAEVYDETKGYYGRVMPEMIERAERDQKHKMALIFRWYFVHTNRLALGGDPAQKVDYQIHCGPALGAFNQWVRGTPLESWRGRHVDEIAGKLMVGTAAILEERLVDLWKGSTADAEQERATPLYAVG